MIFEEVLIKLLGKKWGAQYSLVNNVWGIHYSGDTLFTVTPYIRGCGIRGCGFVQIVGVASSPRNLSCEVGNYEATM